jgi:hypothetical protein
MKKLICWLVSKTISYSPSESETEGVRGTSPTEEPLRKSKETRASCIEPVATSTSKVAVAALQSTSTETVLPAGKVGNLSNSNNEQASLPCRKRKPGRRGSDGSSCSSKPRRKKVKGPQTCAEFLSNAIACLKREHEAEFRSILSGGTSSDIPSESRKKKAKSSQTCAEFLNSATACLEREHEAGSILSGGTSCSSDIPSEPRKKKAKSSQTCAEFLNSATACLERQHEAGSILSGDTSYSCEIFSEPRKKTVKRPQICAEFLNSATACLEREHEAGSILSGGTSYSCEIFSEPRKKKVKSPQTCAECLSSATACLKREHEADILRILSGDSKCYETEQDIHVDKYAAASEGQRIYGQESTEYFGSEGCGKSDCNISQ